MSNFVIEHESDASEIKAYLKELASKGWVEFHSARRKAGITDAQYAKMGSFESEEFQNAHQKGVYIYNTEEY